MSSFASQLEWLPQFLEHKCFSLPMVHRTLSKWLIFHQNVPIRFDKPLPDIHIVWQKVYSTSLTIVKKFCHFGLMLSVSLPVCLSFSLSVFCVYICINLFVDLCLNTCLCECKPVIIYFGAFLNMLLKLPRVLGH